jgi:hypothetical protein
MVVLSIKDSFQEGQCFNTRVYLLGVGNRAGEVDGVDIGRTGVGSSNAGNERACKGSGRSSAGTR